MNILINTKLKLSPQRVHKVKIFLKNFLDLWSKMFVILFLKTKMNFYSQKEIVFVSCLVNHFHIRQTLKIEFFSVLILSQSNISKTQFFLKINKVKFCWFILLHYSKAHAICFIVVVLSREKVLKSLKNINHI